MKLKKQPDGHFYLHSDIGQPLICPHQDAGTEIRIEQPKLQGQQPKQFIDKRHMPCGTWCALFRMNKRKADNLKLMQQHCNSSGAIQTQVIVEG